MYDFASDPTHEAFTGYQSPHILMITNHGVHQWDVVPGLPDTGGQNLFVNMFTAALASLGYRVTIANRGGYPHPVTGEMQVGVRYKDARQRIVYLEDDTREFVRKEDMASHTPQLARYLLDFLEGPAGGYVDMIVSHYWDGAKIGSLVQRGFRQKVPHFWVPHSLGTVKKHNMSPDTWEDLRIDERIEIEKSLVGDLDGVAATSPLIRHALIEDYGVENPLFLPPCIDPQRFHPRIIQPEHPIYNFLSEHCGLSPTEIRRNRIITEISRTDETKRKDVLIRAFARLRERHPDTLLVVSIDEHAGQIHDDLLALIDELGIKPYVAVMGNIWDQLPDVYAVTDVYCSPSVMEGFGMAVQEAAAMSVPVVGSRLIPFVTEYLANGPVEEYRCEGLEKPVTIGEGAVVVEPDDVDGFACAIEKLLEDETLRRRMGEAALRITIPYFTWDGMVRAFLRDIDFAEIVEAKEAGKRYHLDRRTLRRILQAERLEKLSVARLAAMFREEEAVQRFLPDGVCRTDPRDGALVVFNAARSRRPHDNVPPPVESDDEGANDPVSRGETTKVIDVASLSEGFTFINKNLYPVLFPFADNRGAPEFSKNGNGRAARGMHFLQWTSSYFDRDWHNMPQEDRLIVFQRLAALENKLLLDESSGFDVSDKAADGRPTRGYVLVIKNYGRLVGGSLAHGHQQILYSNLKPHRFELNERFERERGETFAAYMLRENPGDLEVRDYGAAVLMVPYFMRRPYDMLLVLKNPGRSHLFECSDEELGSLAEAWGGATGAIRAVMAALGKQVAYNVIVHNGPGAGLYCEFMPYTQETGGLEQLGLWVCQDNPQRVAAHLRERLGQPEPAEA